MKLVPLKVNFNNFTLEINLKYAKSHLSRLKQYQQHLRYHKEKRLENFLISAVKDMTGVTVNSNARQINVSVGLQVN